MAGIDDGSGRSLPEVLLQDLEELLAWEPGTRLTWVGVPAEAGQEADRWFVVTCRPGAGETLCLDLTFWIPGWMGEQGVAAILPAHLDPASCVPGVQASVRAVTGDPAALRAALPRLARTCARLLNELWGRTDPSQVLLLSIEREPSSGPP